MKVWSALLGVLALSALAIGCGGGEETVTKAEFVDQANAICKQALKDRSAAERDFFEGMVDSGKTPDQETIEKRYMTLVLPHLDRMVDELEGIDEPSSDAAPAAAIVASFKAGITTFEDELDEVFKENVHPFQKANNQSRVYGLEDCAQF